MKREERKLDVRVAGVRAGEASIVLAVGWHRPDAVDLQSLPDIVAESRATNTATTQESFAFDTEDDAR